MLIPIPFVQAALLGQPHQAAGKTEQKASSADKAPKFPPPPAKLVDDVSNALAVNAAAKQLHCRIKSFGGIKDQATGAPIVSEVWFRLPGRVWSVTDFPESPVNRHDRWSIRLNESGLLGVDDMRGWYFRRATPTDKSRKDAYGDLISDLPPAATLLASPQQGLTVLGQVMKGFGEWKRSVSGGKIIWKGKSTNGRAELVFDASSKRLLDLSEKIEVPAGGKGKSSDEKAGQKKPAENHSLHWIYSYQAWSTPPEPKLQPDYVKTSFFGLAAPYPVYKDADASAIARRSIDFYDQHRRLDAAVAGDEGTFTVERTGGIISVKSATASWDYKDGQLTYAIGANKGREKVLLGDVPVRLNQLHLPFDRFVTTLLGGYNFAERAFMKGYEARLIGQVSSGDEIEDVVQLRGPVVEAAIHVNHKTGFITFFESTAYTSKGEQLSKSIRTYRLIEK